VDSLTISGGSAPAAAGIGNHGTLTLTNCIVTGNQAQNDGDGIQNNAILTLNNCAVTNNEAGQEGRGIFNNAGGSVTLNGASVVENNQPDNRVGTIC
jgi:hypothetical protein